MADRRGFLRVALGTMLGAAGVTAQRASPAALPALPDDPDGFTPSTGSDFATVDDEVAEADYVETLHERHDGNCIASGCCWHCDSAVCERTGRCIVCGKPYFHEVEQSDRVRLPDGMGLIPPGASVFVNPFVPPGSLYVIGNGRMVVGKRIYGDAIVTHFEQWTVGKPLLAIGRRVAGNPRVDRDRLPGRRRKTFREWSQGHR
jgi:hypothetical protein